MGFRRGLFRPTASGAALVLLCVLAAAAPAKAHAPLAKQIADLTRRIAARPDDAEGYLRRGELHRLLGETRAARSDYQRARRLDPGLATVDLCLGLLEMDAGRPAAALPVLDAFVAKRPSDADGLAARGRARARLGRYREAADDLTRAIAATRAPRAPSPEIYLDRARATAAAGGGLEEALRGLEEGLERLGRPVALDLAAADLKRRMERTEAAAPRPAAVGRAGPAPVVDASGERVVVDDGAGEALSGDEIAGSDREPRAGTAPLAAPLALTRGPYLQSGTSDAIVVRWRTDGTSEGLARYGTTPDNLSFEARDARLVRNHEVAIKGLLPETRYFYSVGSPTETLAGASGDLSFVTAPLAGSRRLVRSWVIGDSGTADANARRVRDAYRGSEGGRVPDVWLMLGDNAYPDGTDSQYQSAVFNMYPDFLARTALWPTLGNHDGHTADSDTQSGPYYDIFTLPSAGQAGGLPSGTEAYYSFDYANIHFICLDSYESDRSPEGAMMTWLRADALSTRQDWTIAFWHHPPYSKGSHDSDREIELVDMRRAALPILETAGVDLVLSGHSHSYERSFLLDGHYGASATLTPAMVRDSGDGREDGSGAYAKPTIGPAPHEGAVFVVAGSSGQISGGPLNHRAMFLSLNSLGSLVLDVDGLRLDAAFLDDRGRTRDRFTLLKGPQNHPPVAQAGVPPSAECDTHAGGTVRLDGTASSDPDEATGGGIVLYEWFEAYGLPDERQIGTGPLVDAVLPVGVHGITLRVTDAHGDTDTDEAAVAVADTVPPLLAIALDPTVLWPPDHRLRTVNITYDVADACDPSPEVMLAGVASSEPIAPARQGDGTPDRGADATFDVIGTVLSGGTGTIVLPAERAGYGRGRTYTITCDATDASGLATRASATVVVPHDLGTR